MKFLDSFFFRDILNLFLGSLPMMAASGLVYWFVRRAIHKKQFGADFKEVRRKAMLHEIIGLLFWIWTALIVGSTLEPKWGFFINIFNVPPSWHMIPEFRYASARMHELLNMLMFVPFGLALPFLARRSGFGWITLAGVVLTFEIEFLQGFTGQRYGDINDVIFNTLGTVVGYLLYMLIKAVFPKFAALCKRSADDVYSAIHE